MKKTENSAATPSFKKSLIDAANRTIDEELSKYPRAKKFSEFLRANRTIAFYQEQANILAVKRLSYNDHGPVHSLIVTGNALKILSIVEGAGIVPSVKKDTSFFGEDEARLVVFAGAYLHDIGNMVHREKHEFFSVVLAKDIVETALKEAYPENERARAYLLGEILHAILAHDEDIQAIGVEASVVKIADGTDCTEGRSRVPYKLGDYGIHTMSARSITDVAILPGKTKEKPLRLEIRMRDATGIFQIEQVLMKKIKSSELSDKVEIAAIVESEGKKEISF
ncbi:MAG: HD domain-containing protein [archaeon]